MSTTTIVLAVVLAGIFLLLGAAKLAAVPRCARPQPTSA